MFGQNPIRSKETDPHHLSVEEMFYTLQGEGPFSGVPALFIRMAGCNLACVWCDTQFETRAEIREPVEHILERIRTTTKISERKLVVITGGEPLRQNIVELVYGLLTSGTDQIQIETAGTLWQESLRPYIATGRIILVCSPKTPKVHPNIEVYCRHWKYIVLDHEGVGAAADGLPAVGTQETTHKSFQQLYRHPGRLDDVTWLSPCDEHDEDKTKRNVARTVKLCLDHGYRLSLQTHKIVNLP